MSDILIINKHGVYHQVPERLLLTVQRQGGRRATDAEAQAFSDGALATTQDPQETADVDAPPWPDYNDINAEQIAARLKTLTPEQIAAVLHYEQDRKNRKTIIDAGVALLESESDN